MRLPGRPGSTGQGQVYRSRLYILNVNLGRTMDCSQFDSDLCFLVACLPNYWMELSLGQSPGRTVAAARRRCRPA